MDARVAIWLTLCALMAGASAAESPSPLGPDWRQLGSRPAAEDLQCAGYADRDERWVVAASGPKITVAVHAGTEKVDWLPFTIQEGKDRLGDRHVLNVDDGWLVGFDGGEFGGALWWYSTEGARSYRVGPRGKSLEALSLPVQGFVRLGEQRLVFRGLDHLTLRAGAVFSVQRDGTGWRLVPFCGLDGQALAWLVQEGGLLVLTAGGVWSVDQRGSVRAEFGFQDSWPWPTSLVAVGPSLYVGMPRYVLQLNRVGDLWKDAWHVRSGCQRAELVDWHCRCLP